MKKVLIALLAVLLLVSFTSCDTQKKIDDAVAEAEAKAAAKETATLDFVETYNVFSDFYNIFDETNKGSYDLSKFDSEVESESKAKEDANKAINWLLICKYGEYVFYGKDLKDVQASGTVDITVEKDGTIVLNAKDVKISCKVDDKSYSVDLSCEMKLKTMTDEENDTETYELEVVSLALDGTTYKPISATLYNSSKDGMKLLSATCSGIELNCDIVKAVIDK